MKVILILALAALAGCKTAPPAVKPPAVEVASNVGEPNGGILGETFTGETIISDAARERYAGLLNRFNTRFCPTVWPEPPGSKGRKWVLTPEARRLWMLLEEMDGEGR